jgi:hypothetical protein
MVWIGDTNHRFAPALLTLLSQLEERWPGKGWLNSPQTGTIGDLAHQAESNSDHNPWLNNTVRALDVAANVSGVPGIVTVTDAPDCEALFAMANRMYGARDPRVWPDGYAMFHHRITDPANPGQFKPTASWQDPHLYHLHISVSQNPAGYNSTAPWPLPDETPSTSSGGATKVTPAATTGGRMFEIIHNIDNGAVRACGPGFWASLNGATPQETLAIVEVFRTSPLCADNKVTDVSTARMQLKYNVFMKGKTA